ncbi:phage portal protein [Macrococcus equipercicus]|uniref:Phage portal protein n=1 Tax=Macrococcus equipercicus TaxID=69967 RepID=A0A9Q9BQC3_9STAP|nr:phage portal protein [Macrococcus equipercicus]UTH14760.1 phage portal protein [Macrococcus equipercicus]
MSDTMTVNNFERDLDYNNHTGIMTNNYINIDYRYGGTNDDLLNDLDTLGKFTEHHISYQAPRLRILSDYYQGKTFNVKKRSTRRADKQMADNRAAHDYAAYVADFINGYFLGNPIDYVVEDETAKEYIESFNDLNDIVSHNRSIGLDLSIYGRAYEYMIRNDKDQVRIYKTDAESTFVIYDDTLEKNSIAAVRYYPASSIDVEWSEGELVYNVEVVTDGMTYYFTATSTNNYKPKQRKEPAAHAFNKVTITEYRANEFRIGDYEKVISLIDLMDSAQSDTANYMSDLNDALLLLIGNFELPTNAAELQKTARIMKLEPPTYETDDNRTTEGHVEGDYIYKKYDVAGAEAYKNRLNNSIHMFTNTPDMSDENFGGNTSGESAKYKLMFLEQRAIIKEGLFAKGLRRRYNLLESIAKTNSELDQSVNLKEMKYKFKRNLPKSMIDELTAYINAGGQISQETLMMLFSFIPDVTLEMERIQEEQQEKQKALENSRPDIYAQVGADNAQEEQ